jgi:hypothetical protein
MINARTSLAGELKRNKLLARRLKLDDTMKTLVTNLVCDGIVWTVLAPGEGPIMRM